MSFSRFALNARRDQMRKMEQHYREQGFADGRAGLPCKSRQIDYAQAWRNGRAAKERDLRLEDERNEA